MPKARNILSTLLHGDPSQISLSPWGLPTPAASISMWEDSQGMLSKCMVSVPYKEMASEANLGTAAWARRVRISVTTWCGYKQIVCLRAESNSLRAKGSLKICFVWPRECFLDAGYWFKFFTKLEPTQKCELLVSLQKITTSGHVGLYCSKFLQPALILGHLKERLVFSPILWVSQAVLPVRAYLAGLCGHLGLDGLEPAALTHLGYVHHAAGWPGPFPTWSLSPQKHLENTHQRSSNFHTSACITSANLPLARASFMASGLKGWRNRLHLLMWGVAKAHCRGAIDPRWSVWPFLQLIAHVAQPAGRG